MKHLPAFRPDRLAALLVTAIVLAGAPVSGIGAQSAATTARPATRIDHRELAADQQVIHALNRLTFGARPTDARQVRAMGLDAWIEQQLHPERIDDSSLRRVLAGYDVLSQNQNELLKEYATTQRERRIAKRENTDTSAGVARDARNAMKQRAAAAAMEMPGDDSAAMRQLALRRNAVVSQIQSSRVARAVASNRQLEEVMTDFWLNHFNVFIRKGPPQAYYIVEYERDVIRPNSMGKFRELLGAVAKSPAMLFYLDNARSMADSTRPRLAGMEGRFAGRDATARIRPQARPKGRRPGMRFPGQNGPLARRGGQPGISAAEMQEMRQRINQLRKGGLNENYGRELLELHTLGADGGYTQHDVINVARALTGWTIRQPATGGGFVFRPQMHDAGDKTVLGRKLAAGRGMEDGEDVLDIVARHPSTARYIATKLARRFVSDNPPKALVDHAAQVFTRTEGDIREVVRAIVTSNEFFSQQAFRSKVKSPFEVVVSALRALDAKPDLTPRAAQAVAYLGQPIYGHQAPNGYPETGESWMNAGAILNRINFGLAIAANRIPGARIESVPTLDSLKTLDRARQVDGVVALLLNGSASPETRKTLMTGENALVSAAGSANAAGEVGAATDGGAVMENAATGDEMMAQNPRLKANNGKQGARRANPLGRSAALPALTGIAQVVGLALGSPEFQRR
ncbi:MAG: DUF1800 domain-containing protein [Gemmatimonadaceae bacterium]|nr:DUF1800 domain-containing protein [Gemmatimonadaceae bacterium]